MKKPKPKMRTRWHRRPGALKNPKPKMRTRWHRRPGAYTRMRNPKGPKLTTAQEVELQHTEHQMARARIYQYGVQKILDDGEYCDCLAVCAQILTEADDIRRAAYKRRAEITSHGLPGTGRRA